MKQSVAVGILLCMLHGAAWAERSDEAVLLIDMAYSQGRWQAKPAAVLPCGGPSKPDSISLTRSLYQLKNADGKVLMRRYIENPRIILVEDPREPSALLEEIKFRLRIPIRQEGKTAISPKEIQIFEFFENGRHQREPSVVVRVDKELEAISKPTESGKRPSCAIVEPSLEKHPRLVAKPGNAISPESLATLIQHDRGVLIRWGLDNNLRPNDLKKLVARNENKLAQLKLDKSTVERLLKEYEAAYRKRYPS